MATVIPMDRKIGTDTDKSVGTDIRDKGMEMVAEMDMGMTAYRLILIHSRILQWRGSRDKEMQSTKKHVRSYDYHIIHFT